MNYSNRFGTKLNVNASYFFNQSNNSSNNSFDRTYFGEDVVAQFYNENSISKTENGNHRFNARITYTIDPKNSFIISPRLSTQNNSSDRSNAGTTMQDLFTMLNTTENVTSSNTSGLNGGGNILYRRGFDKRGRTLSLNLNTNFNNRDSESTQLSQNKYYGAGMNGTDITQRIDQMTMSPTDNSTWSGSVNYTEPVGTRSQFQLNYSPSYNYSYSDRYTYAYDQATLGYTRVDSILSNEFDNKNFTQRGGLSYRYNFKKINFNVGANYQNLRLISEQLFPVDFYGSTSFNSIQPDANIQYQFRQNSQLRIQYRASTRAPSISQLQNVIDNSNPLRLTSGNPDLIEQYTHNVNVRYNLTRVGQGQSLLIFSNLSVSNNFLGSSNFTASKDTLLADGVLLRRGAQYVRPENLGQQQNFITFANLGFPFKPLKSNLSLNFRTTITRSPSLINNTNFYSTNTGISPGLNLSSTISPQVDFNVSYRVNFSSVSYEQPNLDNSSYNQQTGTFQFTWTPWNKLVFVTDFAFNRYDGLGEDIDQNQSVLNAAIGYKFLKKNAGELRLTGFDLFNQNKNINRQITDSYIQDNLTQSLTRYFVMTFTYNLRNFNTASTPSRPSDMGMPGGVRMERWGN